MFAFKQVIVVNADLKMGKGKVCAQVAHASLEAYLKVDKRLREAWRAEGAKKVVLKASGDELNALVEKVAREGVPFAIIRDRGLTQIPPNSLTAVALGPANEKKLDALTGHLKLL